MKRTRFALLFFAKPKEEEKPLMAWPLYNYDPAIEISKLQMESDKWSQKADINAEFVIKKWIKSNEDLRELKRQASDIDGVIVYILTTSLNYNLLFETIKELNKPTLAFTKPYHSLAWPELASLQKEGLPILSISSSNEADLFSGLRALHAYIQLKGSKVLVISTPEEISLETLHQSDIYVGDRAYNEKYYKKVLEFLDLEFVDYRDFVEIMENIPDEEAEAIAKSLKENAYWIREGVTDDKLLDAVKVYLAMKKLIKEKKADAITMNCFTILLRDINALPVTPCIALSLLNDEGIPAACEADLNSMIMQILFNHLAKKPSWIVDPVIDFNDNIVVHAHCTAPTKMKGYTEEGEPYAIDTHDESGKPATIRTKMSIGQTITGAQISSDFTKLIAHKAVIENTPIIDIACRTKVEFKIEDAKKYLWNYLSPLHRVVVYDDLLKELEYISRFMGLEFYLEF